MVLLIFLACCAIVFFVLAGVAFSDYEFGGGLVCFAIGVILLVLCINSAEPLNKKDLISTCNVVVEGSVSSGLLETTIQTKIEDGKIDTKIIRCVSQPDS